MVRRKDQSPLTKLRERDGYSWGMGERIGGEGCYKYVVTGNRDREIVGVSTDRNSSLVSGVRGRFVSHLRLNANIGK